MSSTPARIEQVLAGFSPFSALPAERLAWLASQAQPRRYPLGHTLLSRGELPQEIWLLLQGSLRSLGAGTDPGSPPRTLEKLQAGAVAGWISLLHHCPLEHLICSPELELLALPAAAATHLLRHEPALQHWCAGQLPAAELFALLQALAPSDPQCRDALQRWPETRRAAQLWSAAGEEPLAGSLSEELRWFRSQPPELPQPISSSHNLPLPGGSWPRLIGLSPLPAAPSHALTRAPATQLVAPEPTTVEPLLSLPFEADPQGRGDRPLELGRATGPRDIPLVICLAIASHFRVPANRDALREQIAAILQRQTQLNLINYGQLISSLGLRVVLSELPARQLHRVPPPAVLLFQGKVGLLDGIDRHPTGDQARLLEPELCPVPIPVADLADPQTGLAPLLLIERRPDSKTNRFSWGWYGPYLQPHRRELLEVLATSAVVNTLALVTPLGLQVLIDQVSRNPNSGGALISISAILLLSSLVGAVVRGLRSLIFTNLANRVDHRADSRSVPGRVPLRGVNPEARLP